LSQAPATAVPPSEVRVRTLHHLVILLVAAAILIAAAVLEIPDHESVAFFGARLPDTCTLRRFTGIPCAGCGLTRSFVSLAHGRFGDAWGFHPLGVVLFTTLALQVPFRAAQIRRVRQGKPEWELRGQSVFWWSLFVAMLGHWLWRLAF
jgi:cytochrome b561